MGMIDDRWQGSIVSKFEIKTASKYLKTSIFTIQRLMLHIMYIQVIDELAKNNSLRKPTWIPRIRLTRSWGFNILNKVLFKNVL